jgi:dephospho-CoA kinase
MTAYVVGITGPIGAGKSTVAGILRELGAKALDADAVARDEQLRGTVGYSAIVQQFGTGVLGEDKEIDRAKLAAIVFSDPRKLDQLERILWPRVIARILEAREMLPADAVLAVEAIKLLESSLRRICDQIWVVLARRDTTLARVAARGMPADEALRRLQTQTDEETLRREAHVVIVNDGDRDALRRRVEEAYRAITPG